MAQQDGCRDGGAQLFCDAGRQRRELLGRKRIYGFEVLELAAGALACVAAVMGKVGGFLGVFLFPYLMRWHGLAAAELTAAASSVAGLVLTVALLPETKGKSLEELSMEEPRELRRAA